MSERMKIRNGVVEISDGKAEGIDFVGCHITLGPGATLDGCTVDERTVIEVLA